ncbi:tetratricopeptide repeat protein [Caballeronia telluris]|uniref:tetratricopeptide repeat protein n=1 Tax=Caballeronia telluris TaxID=326475 RepID=UPI000F7457F2|nr:sel1 repeat family protein [Caballeronia telluris]
MKKFIVSSVIFSACCTATPALADLKAAIAAGENGDFKAEVRELVPLAKDGNAEAQALLGELYQLGLGLKLDVKQATRLYRLSAAQGNPKALLSLGALHGSGLLEGDGTGPIKDSSKILGPALFILSAEGGNETAADDVRADRKNMPAMQIRQAEALANEMRKNGNFSKAMDDYISRSK